MEINYAKKHSEIVPVVGFEPTSPIFQGAHFKLFSLAGSANGYMHFTEGLPVVWYFTYPILVHTGDSYEWVPYVFRNFEPRAGFEPARA